MPRWPLAILICLGLAGGGAMAQSSEEIAFAKQFLDRLQLRSIVERREYCGFFGRDAKGRLRATRPRPGKSNSCSLYGPRPTLTALASYHTHAAFDPGSINEVPSLVDLMSDIESKTDGYISTPGGRLWFSDHEAREVRQLCGAGCLTQDPAFRRGKAVKARTRYSMADLEWMMGP